MFPKWSKKHTINERKQITSRRTDPSTPLEQKKITGQYTPESQIDMDRVKDATTAIYIPEEEVNELKDILYMLSETKRLSAGSDIKWLASH
ncbi:hypothetical protein AVEN_129269-1 [Araneus ventricosus]|uniref:Uncharacterized protein n=1 Tax=Araneus ventricosus TaxID=182803 RepID=A0A4Y2HN17_ARAVE|nr:hypothetical protein AVEN_129269-1 [Araneus ventricosus]